MIFNNNLALSVPKQSYPEKKHFTLELSLHKYERATPGLIDFLQ